MKLCLKIKSFHSRTCMPAYCQLDLNTLRLGQNGHHFPDDIFKCIFLNENVWILIKISLKFVPRGPINNIPALFKILVWRWPVDKPLSEPMMVSLLTHIYVSLGLNELRNKRLNLKMKSFHSRKCIGKCHLQIGAMHESHIPQCTIQNKKVHISVLNGVLWDMRQVYCGIFFRLVVIH